MPEGTPKTRLDDPLAVALREAGVGMGVPTPRVEDKYGDKIDIPTELGLMVAQIRGRTSRDALERAIGMVPETPDPRQRAQLIEGQRNTARDQLNNIITQLARMGSRSGDFSQLQQFLEQRLAGQP